MPNQPHPTIARSTEARCVPIVPKEARAKTGKVIPYFVPAWPLSSIGIRTIRLPRATVPIACHQFMPPEIRLLASM